MQNQTFASRIKREPLALFLLIALLLFGLNAVFNPVADADDNPRVIAIDREALLRFAQFRSRVFNEEGVSASFDKMPKPEKKQLLDSLIREEALYREALAWGLDKDDYVIRRRLVQSLEFSVGSEADTETPALDDKALRAFYDANAALYVEAPAISFTHVFFSKANGGEAGALQRARAAQAALNAGRLEPSGTGDRFLYHVNYAEQGQDMIQSHFGDGMAKALFALKPGAAWQGPFVSPHGVHLVKLTRTHAGGLPPFETLRATVARDAAQDILKKRQAAALDKIIGNYRIRLSSDLEGLR